LCLKRFPLTPPRSPPPPPLEISVVVLFSVFFPPFFPTPSVLSLPLLPPRPRRSPCGNGISIPLSQRLFFPLPVVSVPWPATTLLNGAADADFPERVWSSFYPPTPATVSARFSFPLLIVSFSRLQQPVNFSRPRPKSVPFFTPF